MRFRLLRRRLTISAPRVAIRSALPWPFRWLALAVVLGFCAAVALWAFEFGKSIAGLDTVSRDEVHQMKAEIARLRDEGQERQTVALTAESLLATERAAKESLMAQVAQQSLEFLGAAGVRCRTLLPLDFPAVQLAPSQRDGLVCWRLMPCSASGATGHSPTKPGSGAG